jgi:predicted TIM-barrel fold metal-dependent hydrolase
LLPARVAHRADAAFQRPPREVLRENFHVTISGKHHTPSFVGILLKLGADRVLLAADHPSERMADVATWFDALPLASADREMIARTNAIAMLGL